MKVGDEHRGVLRDGIGGITLAAIADVRAFRLISETKDDQPDHVKGHAVSLMTIVVLTATVVVGGLGLVAVLRSRQAVYVTSSVILLAGTAGVGYARATEPEGMGGIVHALVAGLLLWATIVPAGVILAVLVFGDLKQHHRRTKLPRDPS